MHTYFVPVRTSEAGTLALRTGRLRSGERVGLAFTSDTALLLTMGPAQRWILLDRDALTDMLAPLGVEHIRVDPRPVVEPGKSGSRNGRSPYDRAGSHRRGRAVAA